MPANRSQQSRIGEWYRRNGGGGDALRGARRAREELDELISDLEAGDTAHAKEEAADVVICLLVMAEILGCDLEAEIEAKHAINEQRRWAATEDGALYHVRGSDPREVCRADPT